jgi:uncharacterized protein
MCFYIKILQMNPFLKTLIAPSLFSLCALFGIYTYLGLQACVTAFLLIVLEVTLSFDNAVVNARVLTKMSEIWQKRFLTWGILFAVFGTRVFLPILIVSVSVGLSPIIVAKLALYSPQEYGHLLEGAHALISSFGGMFLLMVALGYFFDSKKNIHWISSIEKYLSKFGRIEAIEIGVALSLLLGVSFFSSSSQGSIITSGVLGIITYILIQGIAHSFSVENTAKASGLFLFMYLNVLDSAFSLDGVIGAFALTSQLVVIVVGLGIGAYAVRSLTIYMVRQKTLDSLIYLEHGAHWAILGLSVSMLASLFTHVPELITGLVGIAFIFASYYSSRKEIAKTLLP